MYEHVNGEAELLIRYGAVSLFFLSYEHEGGDYVGVDIIDLETPINGYGLFRLYAGCDGEEYRASDALVLADEYTPHAVWGRYFIRINIDTTRNSEAGSELVQEFLDSFTNRSQEQPPLPLTLAIVKKHVSDPCEVSYHPEHIDYDLESGPGYSFIGPDGTTYYLTLHEEPEQSEYSAGELQQKGISNVLFHDYGVIWTKPDATGSSMYMKEILEALNEGKRERN